MSRHSSDDPRPAGAGDIDGIPVGIPILLTAKEVKRGRNTFDGNDEPQYEVVWTTPDDTWIYDWISPTHVRPTTGGGPSKALQLAASLAGRIPLQVANVWWDDESYEYGFDKTKTEVAGRLMQGVQVAAELFRKKDKGGVERLRVARYLPANQMPATAAPAAQAAPIVSADGLWWWDGQQWQPRAPQQAPAPVQERLI